MEEWRDVIVDREEADTYKGLYQVSNLGRVKSLHRGKEKILKPRLTNRGYLRVLLCRNGKRKLFRIHRLVGLAFLNDTYFEGAEIDHINTIKTDNRVENLRWCTSIENINNELTREHHKESFRGINHPKAKAVICITTGEVFATAKEGAEYYEIKGGSSSVSKCCRGNRKYTGKCPTTNEPLVWKYLEE